MSSPYPRDDFDAVTPPRDGRRGAHRAAPRRSHGVVAPLVIAAVVAVAGVTTWAALSPTGAGTASASGAATEASAAAAGPAADPAGDAADPAGDAADPAATGDPADDASPAPPDRSAPVAVLNGTGTSGLAATTAATLEAAGWTVSSTGNATSAQRSAHDGTTVLYPEAALGAPAAALADSLGGTAALEEDGAAGTLTVLLLP